MTEPSLNTHDTDDLLARKDALVREVAEMLHRLSLPIGYPYDVMMDARVRGLGDAGYIDLLERLLEIELIKYTLCARRLRAEVPDADE